MSVKQVIIVIALALSVLMGCSSIKVTYDYDQSRDFSRYKTYAWLTNNVLIDVEDGLMYLRLPGDEVRAHVNTELEDKGFVLERRIPQFLILVYLGLKEQVEVTDKGGKNYGKGKLKVEVEVRPEGAVYMDIIDAQSFDLIWRGTAIKETEDEPTEEKMRKNIRKALDKLIDGFPPKS
jgi:hypothetical protein